MSQLLQVQLRQYLVAAFLLVEDFLHVVGLRVAVQHVVQQRRQPQRLGRMPQLLQLIEMVFPCRSFKIGN